MRASAVQTRLARCSRVMLMKKRLLITGLVLAALLLALYGVMFGTGAD
jgi:predicted small secreted protein